MTKKQVQMAIAVLILALESSAVPVANAGTKSSEQETPAVSQAKLYCNIKALDPATRARHKQLTDKLIAQRTQVVETEKGYEFQYTPAAMSVAELGGWVVDESKCCPFFDFHIDLENEGTMVCLRLTGPKGIKDFIRLEFRLETIAK